MIRTELQYWLRCPECETPAIPPDGANEKYTRGFWFTDTEVECKWCEARLGVERIKDRWYAVRLDDEFHEPKDDYAS